MLTPHLPLRNKLRSAKLKGIFAIKISQETYRSMNSIALLTSTLATFISIYTILLIVRVLLTWFPTIDWYSQPFAALSQITDPYLNLFRSIIPPLGGIDISPILAIFLLQLAGNFLSGLNGSPTLGF